MTHIKAMDGSINTHCIGSLTTPPFDRMLEQSRRVFATDGVAPTVHTFGGGNQEIKIMIELM